MGDQIAVRDQTHKARIKSRERARSAESIQLLIETKLGQYESASTTLDNRSAMYDRR
jgi:diphthamide synthase subunit DPH2